VLRRSLDRAIAVVARLAVRGFFRTAEIEGFDTIPDGRPVLIVANHFNGFVDPVILVAALRRLPRFLARGTLWNIRWIRPLLALAGMLPVYRPDDRGPRAAGNASTFAAAHRELAAGGTVAIFPEGTTHDSPRLVKVRTGAARIALGARAGGVGGLSIVPVGITFEDKIALRSRVLIHAGPPLDLDGNIGRFVEAGSPATEDNHEAVRRLTEEIHERLRDVSPDFATFREAEALSRAALITLRTDVAGPQDLIPLSPRQSLASRLGRAPVDHRERVVDMLARYELDLDLVGVSDDEVMPPASRRVLLGRFFGLLVRFVILAPFALAGLLVNALPAFVVWVAGRRVREPVTKGTVRMLVALIVFPAMWILVAVLDVGADVAHRTASALTFPLGSVFDLVFGNRAGFWPSLLVFVACPLFGLATMYVLERIGALIRMWRGWLAVTDRAAHLSEVLEDRGALVGLVRRVGEAGDRGLGVLEATGPA
jgi:1-acyl-sn-glycerol-3-phosphate acyltransferase